MMIQVKRFLSEPKAVKEELAKIGLNIIGMEHSMHTGIYTLYTQQGEIMEFKHYDSYIVFPPKELIVKNKGRVKTVF